MNSVKRSEPKGAERYQRTDVAQDIPQFLLSQPIDFFVHRTEENSLFDREIQFNSRLIRNFTAYALAGGMLNSFISGPSPLPEVPGQPTEGGQI